MPFNTAFNTVFQKVSTLTQSHGYQFSDIQLVKLITGYADEGVSAVGGGGGAGAVALIHGPATSGINARKSLLSSSNNNS